MRDGAGVVIGLRGGICGRAGVCARLMGCSSWGGQFRVFKSGCLVNFLVSALSGLPGACHTHRNAFIALLPPLFQGCAVGR
jgi:hypothetical protein